MKINLRPLSERAPTWVLPEAYEELTQRKEKGWSTCQDEQEWLAKLHYLREGFRAEKLTREAFETRELRLVKDWLEQML